MSHSGLANVNGAHQIEALLTKPWFHNFSSSQQAEEILGQKDVGYFLARFRHVAL